GAGECWLSAFNDLKDALAVATAGDQLWVAEGTYKPGTKREDTFSIPAGVSVYGGFDALETALAQRNVGANTTIFDGDIDNNRGKTTYPSSYAQRGDALHVVTVDIGAAEARLDGVTIRGGYADDAVGYGGGLYQASGTLTMSE